VCQSNNPNKKPSYIHLTPHVTIIWVYITWIAKQYNGLLLTFYYFYSSDSYIWVYVLAYVQLTYIHTWVSQSWLLELMRNQWIMFTMSPVHTRDHDRGCPELNWNMPRGKWGRIMFICPGKGGICVWGGASTPNGEPEGPQVEPKF